MIYLQAMAKLTYIITVSQVIRSENMGRLMFAVVLNQISLVNHPEFDLYPKAISQDLWRGIFQTKEIAFSSAGSICDCGKLHTHINILQSETIK